MNEASQEIVNRYCSYFRGMTLTQEEADAIKDQIQICVHPGMIRPEKEGTCKWSPVPHPQKPSCQDWKSKEGK